MSTNGGQFNRMVALFLTGVLAIVITGCAPKVLPATQHGSVPAEHVKIYQKQPAKYEDFGLITVPVTPAMKWDDRGESVAGFDALKAKAGTMGANGVLLVVDPAASDYQVTVGYHGNFYQVPMKNQPKSALAKAIFVVK